MIIPPFKTMVVNDIPVNYSFFTNNLGSQIDLDYELEGKYLTITNEFWMPGYNDLGVNIDFSISAEKIKMLYDPRKGVALDDAILGVGISFKLPSTNYQYSVNIAEISKDTNEEVKCSFSQLFPKRIIRFELRIEIFIYLKRSKEQKIHYANACGSKICHIDELILKTGGSGLLFPIVRENDEGGPLWWITTELGGDSELWDEPFNSNVFALHLNQAHRQYYKCKEVLKNGKQTISQLFFEIIVLCCSSLINSLKEIDESELYDSVFINDEYNGLKGTAKEVVYCLLNKTPFLRDKLTKEYVKTSNIWEINRDVQCGLAELFVISEVEDGME